MAAPLAMSLDRSAQTLTNPKRLAALAESGLGQGSEPSDPSTFDRLTTLVARVLRVPLAFVSLVEENRQSFVGLHGDLPGEWSGRRETPISHSFCQYVVQSGEPLIVDDVAENEQVCGNPAVKDLNITAYLGVPLTTSDGYTLGSLGVIDTEARRWTDEEVETLKNLAAFANTELELRRTSRRLSDNVTNTKQSENSRADSVHLLVHDLRTPLNSLLLGIQTLPLLGDLNEDQRESLELANRGGQTLMGLIDDLLDLNSADAGQSAAALLTLASVPPAELLDAAYRQVTILARDRSIGLSVDLPPAGKLPATVQVDRDKIVRALVNLLGNAIKFTPAKGSVVATVRQNDVKDAVVFIVRDTGRGIARKDLTRIFQRFVRLDEDPVGAGGRSSGLGLASCKMVAEAHGGSISVESEPGKGSTFALQVPVRQPGAGGRGGADGR